MPPLTQAEAAILKALLAVHEANDGDPDFDAENGGVYEHKLAFKLGHTLTKSFKLGASTHPLPPQAFVGLITALEAQGFVKSNERLPGYPSRGVRLTAAGRALAETL